MSNGPAPLNWTDVANGFWAVWEISRGLVGVAIGAGFALWGSGRMTGRRHARIEQMHEKLEAHLLRHDAEIARLETIDKENLLRLERRHDTTDGKLDALRDSLIDFMQRFIKP
jgi:hypothetical protein